MTKRAAPFLVFAIAWGLLGGVISGEEGCKRFFLFWLTAICDLWALAQVVRFAGHLILAQKKSNFMLFQAFYWTTIKLACLGIFILLLKRVREGPHLPVVLGVGTLALIPLAGGVLQHFWQAKKIAKLKTGF